MDIDLPIKSLMSLICFLIGNANIPDIDFKKKICLCEIRVLNRFFKDEELSEMIEMLQTQTKSSEVQRIIEKYGQGFHSIYFDGKADGIFNGKVEVAKNLLKNGLDEGFVSQNTGLPVNEIKKLKRKL